MWVPLRLWMVIVERYWTLFSSLCNWRSSHCFSIGTSLWRRGVGDVCRSWYGSRLHYLRSIGLCVCVRNRMTWLCLQSVFCVTLASLLFSYLYAVSIGCWCHFLYERSGYKNVTIDLGCRLVVVHVVRIDVRQLMMPFPVFTERSCISTGHQKDVKYVVDFDTKINEIVAETKYMEMLGFPVPEIARNVALQVSRISVL